MYVSCQGVSLREWDSALEAERRAFGRSRFEFWLGGVLVTLDAGYSKW